MRILFLLTQDLESPSGLGRYLPIAQMLARSDHQVTIAALHPDFLRVNPKIFVVHGIQVKYVAPMHVRKSAYRKEYYNPSRLIWLTLRATTNLVKAALQDSYDLVLVGKPHPMNGIAGLAAKFIRGAQLLVDCDDDETASNRFSRGWQRRVISFFETVVPRLADWVSTNTYTSRDRLVSLGVDQERILYLPNGIDLDRFPQPNQNDVGEIRNQLLLSDEPVILYLGSVSFVSHPVDLLVRAFQLVVKVVPEAKLVVVGGGENFDALVELAASLELNGSIRFCGRVHPGQVRHYYHLAAVSVDPVYDDAAARARCPLKMFESWACGTPFITSDIGDRRRLLGDPPAGLLVRAGDPEDLAKKIIRLLQDPNLAIELRDAGRQRALGFQWVDLVKRLAPIIDLPKDR